MKLYLASGLQNRATVAQIAQELRELGHVITYDWTAHGSVQGDGPERMAEVAQAEIAGVLAAEMVVAILPGGRGTHVEIGAAIGAEIPVLVIAKSEADTLIDGVTCAFYYCPGVWMHTISSDGDVSMWLAEWIDCVCGPYSEYLEEQIAEAKPRRGER